MPSNWRGGRCSAARSSYSHYNKLLLIDLKEKIYLYIFMKPLIVIVILFLPWMLGAQQRDRRTREYLSPTRIVWQQQDELISGTEQLLRPGNGQADLANRYICKIRSTEGKKPALLFDFGKELQGGIQIVTGMPPSQQPIRVRVRLGESVSEAMSEPDGLNGAGNDHAMRDFVVSLPWLGVLETGNSGFRFVRIDLLDDDTELHLKELRAISTFLDIPYIGSFKCSDERLNRIWETGAYTVHLNMQEYLWDGIKRDRLVWVGDLHPEVMTVSAVFGHHEVVSKSLDLIRDITPLPQWMNGISSYSLWWLLIHWDWYLHHGDLPYLQQQQPYIGDLIRQLIVHFDEEGNEQLTGNRFLDWPSSENRVGIDAGLQALMVLAMEASCHIATALQDDLLRSECERALSKSRNAEKALTAFLQSDSKPDAPGNKQAAALLALAGLLEPKRANDNYLSANGGHGFSTFYGYYMLRAMAKASNHQGALDVIRSFWGAMLDLGATTFWEDFNLDWLPGAAGIDEPVPAGKKDIHGDFGAYCYQGFRHSLCHGWASGPTSWLSEQVLGVQPMEPGCRVVRIAPHLGDLDWAEGSYPTPYGIISVRHEKLPDGTINSQINLPDGVTLKE